ncbi:MAG: LON peptidase substrate-binding domain-containing protein, partial [Sulfurifustaceae bacterium]
MTSAESPKPTMAADKSPISPITLPEDALIILPVRNTVLFPGMVLPLTIGRQRSIAAAQEAMRSERPIGVLQQRDPGVDVPGPNDLYSLGTVATILRYVTSPEGAHHVISQGQKRFQVVEYLEGYPFLVARVQPIETVEPTGKEIEARILHLKRRAA